MAFSPVPNEVMPGPCTGKLCHLPESAHQQAVQSCPCGRDYTRLLTGELPVTNVALGILTLSPGTATASDGDDGPFVRQR